MLVDQHPDDSETTSSSPRRSWRRELGVTRAIARGLSNAEIAAELFISITTVKTDVGRILEKLQVSNRVQIAACVQRSER